MAKLREPKGKFQEMVRRLAEEAITVTHHDADEQSFASEVTSMERRFTNILRAYLSARSRTTRPAKENEGHGRDER